MKFRIVALSISLAILVVGMVCGLYQLRRDVGRAFVEYREARRLERAKYRVAYAQILLSAPPPGMTDVAQELIRAAELLEELNVFQENEPKQGHRQPSAESIATSQAHDLLRDTIAGIVAQNPTPTAQIRESIKSALRSLEHATKMIDAQMIRTRRVADVTMHYSIMIVVALSIAIGVAAAVMSLWQYRSVITPVRRLRDSAREFASGAFTRRVAVSGDDEFAEVEREFNAMAEELDTLYRDLEQKVRSKSRELVRSERLISVGFLAAGVAHEINNPLNIITGHAELAIGRLRKLGLDADRAGAGKALEIIREEAFRCKEITDQLLSLARANPKHDQIISVKKLATDVQTLVAGLRQFHDRALDVRCDSTSDASVSGNVGELKQVLLNLTINALQAVEPRVGQVLITARCNDRWVELSVTDNGRGMSQETIDHVFEPFFTERKGNTERGVGLGLSITHAIVEAHGGHLHAESDGLDRGSRFTLRLPIAEETPA